MVRLKRGSVIFFLIFAVVGALFTALGSVLLYQSVKDRSLCTVPAPAKVIRMEAHRSTSKKSTSTTYAPVVEYSYKDETYVYISNVSSNPPKYHAGDSVEVMLNPDEPTTAYITGDSTVYWLCGIFIAAGLFCIIFGAVTIIKTNR